MPVSTQHAARGDGQQLFCAPAVAASAAVRRLTVIAARHPPIHAYTWIRTNGLAPTHLLQQVTDHEKLRFEALANADKERYEAEMASYVAPTQEQLLAVKEAAKAEKRKNSMFVQPVKARARQSTHAVMIWRGERGGCRAV